ncbi:TonB-dependent receptor [hydrothermal vent metagenome]|uniref:TonB-dependent receptor n=1 Tax=hydrothermal vent metagenome TaxID=652676 RepID=A0A1W1CX89_9ZZZZ
MKRIIYLSFACSLLLQAAQVELETINVEAKADTEVIKDVHGEDIKSADLAEALFKQSPSVSLVRRSGIANDIIVRGQKKDNINVTIDGAKVCGACPNRMDPPVSHVLTNNIDFIEINEGPFNVEDFGVLSADIKIHMKKPKPEFFGEFSFNIGSFDYKKGAFTLSGGTDAVRFLLSTSYEQGGQYKDGSGDTFAQQQDRYIVAHPGTEGMGYSPLKREIDAFTKKTVLAKMFWDITDTQSLELSYARDESDDVLYPNTPMDADYDNGDIYNLTYTLKYLGKYSKKLTLSAYQSEVDHPMSNHYRKSTATKGVIKHWLTTKMQGAKLKNEFELSNHMLTLGLDYSKRNWDGAYYKNNTPFPAAKFHSIWESKTQNLALFAKDKIHIDKWEVNFALRYDNTDISTDRAGVEDNSYNGLSGNIYGIYHADMQSKYFIGLGFSSRVPDGKELYYHDKMGQEVGTVTLKKVQNREFDMGVESMWGDFTLKSKFFYSDLKDYIAYNAITKRFENVDATIWGIDVLGTYVATESIYFDYGLSYQKGKKQDALIGQSDKDLAEIPPLKLNLALNYDYDESLSFKAEGIYSAKWSKFDSDNGEQLLGSYTVFNLKGTKRLGKHLKLTLGVDNVFDKTYAVSNTYKDLTLISGSSNEDVMLMNESGRYIYVNANYTF